MNELLLWSFVCFAVAAILFAAEVLIPSGGILGGSSVVAVIAGIVLLFRVDTLFGLIGILVTFLALPFLFAVALKAFPHTPIGRLLTLRSPARGSRGRAGPVEESPDRLVGETGKAVTDLRPVGTCLISGKRMDAMAERGTISRGERVRVIAAEGMYVKVRPDAEEEEAPADAPS